MPLARTMVLVYGIVAYILFLGIFLYAIGFVGGQVVPKSIDSGTEGPLLEALLVNAGLLLLFALQHSIMARQGFKRWWTRLVPRPIERSTFVLATCAVLGLTFWQWRPLTDVIWAVDGRAGQLVLEGVRWLGWAIVLISTFIIDHFELFGLKQVWLYARGRSPSAPAFRLTGLYRHVRHPLLLGFLIAFWAAPTMTLGHLVFSLAVTGYVLIAVRLEERDLVRFHGESYTRYQRRVPMLLPRFRGVRELEATGDKAALGSGVV